MVETAIKRKKVEGSSLPDHRHCIVCGGVVPPSRKPPVCEGQCEEELIKREKRSRTFNLVWMIMIFGLLALMFLGLFMTPK